MSGSPANPVAAVESFAQKHTAAAGLLSMLIGAAVACGAFFIGVGRAEATTEHRVGTVEAAVATNTKTIAALEKGLAEQKRLAELDRLNNYWTCVTVKAPFCTRPSSLGGSGPDPRGGE